MSTCRALMPEGRCLLPCGHEGAHRPPLSDVEQRLERAEHMTRVLAKRCKAAEAERDEALRLLRALTNAWPALRVQVAAEARRFLARERVWG